MSFRTPASILTPEQQRESEERLRQKGVDVNARPRFDEHGVPIRTDAPQAEGTGSEGAGPKCPCGRLATCLGVSEGSSASYGCDKCCSHCEPLPATCITQDGPQIAYATERCQPHRHEDGYCYALSDVPEFIAELIEAAGEADNEVMARDAEIAALRERVEELEKDADAIRQARDILDVPTNDDVLAYLRETEYPDPREAARALEWITDKTNEGRGAVIFSDTVNGNIGVWIGLTDGDDTTPALGSGDTALEAILSALTPQSPDTAEENANAE